MPKDNVSYGNNVENFLVYVENRDFTASAAGSLVESKFQLFLFHENHNRFTSSEASILRSFKANSSGLISIANPNSCG